MQQISGKTRVVAIIGDPVAHSRSPVIHNAAFRSLALDFVYVALRVRSVELRRAMAGVRALALAGLNVTVPHKERMLNLLDRLTPRAKAIGAVNTVIRRGSELIGDNTDAEGFRRALAELRFSPRGKRVLILGAGGSARAVVWAIARSGARRLTILNRDERRAASLARFAQGLGPNLVTTGPLGCAHDPELLASVDLVVHCTSLGLDGETKPPLDVAALNPTTIVYDLVYGERLTPLVAAASRRGLRAADGRRMLLHQAGLSFHAWTGKRAPLNVMADALGQN